MSKLQEVEEGRLLLCVSFFLSFLLCYEVVVRTRMVVDGLVLCGEVFLEIIDHFYFAIFVPIFFSFLYI